MSARKPSLRGFAAHCTRPRTLATVAVLIAVTLTLAHLHVFQRVSLVSFDNYERLRRVWDEPHAKFTRVVAIDEQEVAFKRCRPIDAELLTGILKGIAHHRPAVIVVDFDTADESFASVRLPDFEQTRIVWATWPENDTEPFQLHKTMGRIPAPGPTGLAVIYPELDRVNRGAQRFFAVKPGRRKASLHMAAVAAYCEQRLPGACDAATGLDNLPESKRDLHHIFVERPEHKPLRGTSFLGVNQDAADSDLAGKIVFLGGLYGTDRHLVSSLKQVPGCVLLAEMAEAELRGDHYHEVGLGGEIAIKLLITLMVLAVYYFSRPARRLWWMGALAAAVLTMTFCAYTYGEIWANVLPLLLGLWMEQQHEIASHPSKF